MKITCENCSVQHELTPPAWVASSNRPFRFRCSACGRSQFVKPPEQRSSDPDAVPTEVPTRRPAVAQSETPPPPIAPPALPEKGETVYLKQSGQIYSVQDWATLKRWILDRRVDESDLVSDGGVRWEPTGSHPELAPLFAQIKPAAKATPANPSPAPAPRSMASRPPSILPFGEPSIEDTPFGQRSGADAWTDEDTEGIPLGLPPLAEIGKPKERKTEEILVAPLRAAAAQIGVAEYEPTGEQMILSSDELASDQDEISIASDHRKPHTSAREDRKDDSEAETVTLRRRPKSIPEPPDPARTGPTGRYRVEVPTEPAKRRRSSSAKTEPPKPPEGAAASQVDPLQVTPLRPQRDRSEALTEPMDLRALGLGEPPPPKPRSNAGDVTEKLRLPEKPANEDPTVSLSASDQSFPFEEEWAEEVRPRSSRWLWFGALALTALVLPLGWWWWSSLQSVPAPKPPPAEVVPAAKAPPPAPAPAPAKVQVPAPAKAATVEPSEPPAPGEVQVAPQAPSPQVKPPTRPKPDASSSQGLSTLRERGWDAADREQWVVSQRWFQRALDQFPGDDESTFGVGYALLMQGKTAEAAPYLCRARNTRSEELKREVSGIVSEHKITCD